VGRVRKWRGEAFGAKGGLEGGALEEFEERPRQERETVWWLATERQDIWWIKAAQDQRRGV
jgi:hypothetical protein